MTDLSQKPSKPGLVPALLRAVPPAYVFPAVSSLANAHLVGSDALATAAFTTIAVPSAAAAAAVTARDHARPRRRGFGRAAISGAALGLVPALAVTGVLVVNEVVSPMTWLEAPPSAAIGGAIASVIAARRASRAAESTEPEDRPDEWYPTTATKDDRMIQTVGVR